MTCSVFERSATKLHTPQHNNMNIPTNSIIWPADVCMFSIMHVHSSTSPLHLLLSHTHPSSTYTSVVQPGFSFWWCTTPAFPPSPSFCPLPILPSPPISFPPALPSLLPRPPINSAGSLGVLWAPPAGPGEDFPFYIYSHSSLDLCGLLLF